MYNLATTIDSPTDAYFKLDESTGKFYYDKLNRVIWKVDKKTGYVCTHDNSVYVAKSISEFLSHIHFDSTVWNHIVGTLHLLSDEQKIMKFKPKLQTQFSTGLHPPLKRQKRIMLNV